MEGVQFSILHQLSLNAANIFLALDPQLTNLSIETCYHLSPLILQNIENRAPNIEKAKFPLTRNYAPNMTLDDCIMHLSRLPK